MFYSYCCLFIHLQILQQFSFVKTHNLSMIAFNFSMQSQLNLSSRSRHYWLLFSSAKMFRVWCLSLSQIPKRADVNLTEQHCQREIYIWQLEKFCEATKPCDLMIPWGFVDWQDAYFFSQGDKFPVKRKANSALKHIRYVHESANNSWSEARYYLVRTE